MLGGSLQKSADDSRKAGFKLVSQKLALSVDLERQYLGVSIQHNSSSSSKQDKRRERERDVDERVFV